MFKRKDIKQISKILQTDEDVVKTSLSVATSVLKKQEVSTYSIARAFKIFLDRIENSRVKKNRILTSSYPIFNFKHKVIKLYRSDIIDLYLQNIYNPRYGYGSIAKEIKDKYKTEVSRSTIKLYIEKWVEHNNGKS